ncbi:hypothetical protein MCEKH45_00853 [Methylophilaceae bacterium]
MLDSKKLIEAKIVLAKRGAKPSAADVNNRIPAGQTQVNNFAVLDMDWQGARKLY